MVRYNFFSSLDQIKGPFMYLPEGAVKEGGVFENDKGVKMRVNSIKETTQEGGIKTFECECMIIT